MAQGFLSGKGFLSEAAGDMRQRKFSIEGMIEDLPAAALSVGINNLGGMLASVVYAFFAERKPGWGALGVEFVAIGMKAAFQPTSDLNILLREGAAGMAGTVGKELSDEVLLWWRASEWAPTRVFKKGDLVKYQGAYYQAMGDVPQGGAPGVSAEWTRLRAQGMAGTNWPDLAQAFMAQPSMADGVAGAVAKVVAEKQGFNAEETGKLKSDISEAMQTFARVVWDAA